LRRGQRISLCGGEGLDFGRSQRPDLIGREIGDLRFG
jgi:hypothetical protein